jgi:hypothetical protein
VLSIALLVENLETGNQKIKKVSHTCYQSTSAF